MSYFEFRTTIRNGNDSQQLQQYGDAKISMAISSAASLTFVIYPNDPAYQKLKEWTTYVDVQRDEKYIFRGRVAHIQPKNNADGSFYKEITCESALAYLNDTMTVWEKVNSKPGDFFKKMINNHNSQVDNLRQLKVGTVNVTNSTDNLYCYVEDGITTLAEIQTDLLNNDDLQGELWIRYEKDGNYIDWIKDPNTHGLQDIRLQKNLIELTSSPDISTIATVLYPFGSVVENVETDEKATDVSTPHITIASVNGGKNYIEDTELVKKYGRIAKSKIWDNVKEPKNLLDKAKAYLESLKKIKVSYTMQAVDLFPLRQANDPLDIGKYYHFVNPAINIDEWLRIVGTTIDLNKPLETTYVIGDQLKRLVDYNLQSSNAMEQLRRLTEQNRAGLIQIKKLKSEVDLLKEVNEQLRHDLEITNRNQGTDPGGPTTAVNGDWGPAIKHAASLMNVNLSDAKLAQIKTVIQGESGGSESAFNGWDENAKAGHPSKGLLQFIDSTFNIYALEGHKDIWKGFDQLLAMFNDSTWENDLTTGGWGPHGAPRFKKVPVAEPTENVAKLQAAARKYKNVKYVWGGGRNGASPDDGLDCSSFVWWVYKDMGITLPGTTTTTQEPSFFNVDKPQAGDVGFYGSRGGSTHIVLFLDENTYANEEQPGVNYQERKLNAYNRPSWFGRNAQMHKLLFG